MKIKLKKPAKRFHLIPPTAFYKPLSQKLLQSFFLPTLYHLQSLAK